MSLDNDTIIAILYGAASILFICLAALLFISRRSTWLWPLGFLVPSLMLSYAALNGTLATDWRLPIWLFGFGALLHSGVHVAFYVWFYRKQTRGE